MQSALVAYLRPSLSIHPAATAYQKGSSIHQNALRRAGSAAVRSYDFEDFFPSLVAEDWTDYCARKSIFDCPEDVAVRVNSFEQIALDREVTRKIARQIFHWSSRRHMVSKSDIV
jgi:hypothetical protein